MAFNFEILGLPTAVTAQIGEYAKIPDSQRRRATRDCAEWVDLNDQSEETLAKVNRPGCRVLRHTRIEEDSDDEELTFTRTRWNLSHLSPGGGSSSMTLAIHEELCSSPSPLD